METSVQVYKISIKGAFRQTHSYLIMLIVVVIVHLLAPFIHYEERGDLLREKTYK